MPTVLCMRRQSVAQENEVGGARRGVVRAADDVPFRDVAAGRRTSMQVLVGPDEGAPNFVLRRFRMEHAGGIPLHTNEVEHEQFVLRGRARITIGGEVHDVSPNDTLYIPAGVPHSYEVIEAPFEFLCVVPNAPDAIRLQEEGC
jgi:quercetin dioxygenase-like cupin family protein